MKTYRPWALAVALALPVVVLAAEPAVAPCAAVSGAAGGIEMTDLIARWRSAPASNSSSIRACAPWFRVPGSISTRWTMPSCSPS